MGEWPPNAGQGATPLIAPMPQLAGMGTDDGFEPWAFSLLDNNLTGALRLLWHARALVTGEERSDFIKGSLYLPLDGPPLGGSPAGDVPDIDLPSVTLPSDTEPTTPGTYVGMQDNGAEKQIVLLAVAGQPAVTAVRVVLGRFREGNIAIGEAPWMTVDLDDPATGPRGLLIKAGAGPASTIPRSRSTTPDPSISRSSSAASRTRASRPSRTAGERVHERGHVRGGSRRGQLDRRPRQVGAVRDARLGGCSRDCRRGRPTRSLDPAVKDVMAALADPWGGAVTKPPSPLLADHVVALIGSTVALAIPAEGVDVGPLHFALENGIFKPESHAGAVRCGRRRRGAAHRQGGDHRHGRARAEDREQRLLGRPDGHPHRQPCGSAVGRRRREPRARSQEGSRGSA